MVGGIAIEIRCVLPEVNISEKGTDRPDGTRKQVAVGIDDFHPLPFGRGDCRDLRSRIFQDGIKDMKILSCRVGLCLDLTVCNRKCACN